MSLPVLIVGGRGLNVLMSSQLLAPKLYSASDNITHSVTIKRQTIIKSGNEQFHTHPVGRSINSDWFVNSFIMVIYENFFQFSQN